MLDCHLKYGDIVLIWLFFLPWVNVSNISDIKDVLITQKFPKDPRFYKECLETLFGQRAMGTSLLTNLDDTQWRHRRSLMNPAFHRLYLRNLMCHFNQSSEIILSKLRGQAEKGLDTRMVDAFSLVTLDVICKAGFGIDLDVINDPHSPFIQAYNLILKGVEEAFVNPFHKWDFTSYPRQREVIKALQFLRSTGRDTIRRRCEVIRRGDDNPKVLKSNFLTFKLLPIQLLRVKIIYFPSSKDILGHILSDGRDPMLSEEDLIDDFVTFFSSGHETTSSILSFCVLELAHNQDALTRVEREIKEVLGTRNDVTYDDLPRFKYLDCCLKETLRLYPPAPGIIRITPGNVTLGGYKVPKGTTTSASSFVMGRHPAFWDNPGDFVPERWEDDDSSISACIYFPFSLGPRNCIGQQFAIMESKVVLVKFLKMFTFKLLPGQTKRIHERGSLQPMDGVVCKLSLREN